ncbi:hypothetical protein [Oligoflexus tunisiensis]|uniref:hypothetical protein n=1 Tax=Oligoflexus tunisiensis TaxID=708132 RepID=UPI00114C8708|nr:hypothetical protein [Oligoflexus tunisiensis]
MSSFKSLNAFHMGNANLICATLLFSGLCLSCSEAKKGRSVEPNQVESPESLPTPDPTPLPLGPEPKENPEINLSQDGRLDYSGFRDNSFASVSWDKKCEGIQDFFEDFTKAYLEPGIDLKVKSDTCYSSYGAKDVNFTLKVSLAKNDKNLDLVLHLFGEFNWVTRQIEIKTVNVERSEGTSHTAYMYQSSDSIFGRKLLFLPVTFKAWAEEKSNNEVTVYGVQYQQYADELLQTFGPGTKGASALTDDLKTVTMQFEPSGAGSGHGTVKFLGVDPDLFVDHDEKMRKHLGCETLECLNSASIQYQVLGPKLVLSAPPIKAGQCRIETEFFFYDLEKTDKSFKLVNGLWGMHSSGTSVPCEE